ncbi:MAG: DUF3606 domain-containing protein [Bdellovibrionales bacterium]|nr:DUF3606 domain-containing protein [Bdellovibrionales bacterium]
MPDNLNRTRPEDPQRINVNQSWEVSYWTKVLGVTEEQLKAAVKAVGTSVVLVRAYLGK